MISPACFVKLFGISHLFITIGSKPLSKFHLLIYALFFFMLRTLRITAAIVITVILIWAIPNLFIVNIVFYNKNSFVLPLFVDFFIIVVFFFFLTWVQFFIRKFNFKLSALNSKTGLIFVYSFFCGCFVSLSDRSRPGGLVPWWQKEKATKPRRLKDSQRKK